nr:thermosome subunit alpha [Candidatus Njordarchaeota archaeon]
MSIPRKKFGGQLPTRLNSSDGRHETLLGNLNVARVTLGLISDTLGPFGMSKAVLKKKKGNKSSDLLVTSHGASVLENTRTEHPVARLLAGLAKAQKDENGDGATSAVVLACSLLINAVELLNMGLHPSTISEGYGAAQQKATDILRGISSEIDPTDYETLHDIVKSVLTSRVIVGSPKISELFTDFVVELARSLALSSPLDLDNVRIVKKLGGSLADSELMLNGFLLDDREVTHPNMPLKVEGVSIALLNSLEVKRLPSKSVASPLESVKIETTELDEYREFLRSRAELAKNMADKINNTGANVVLVNMGIDELVEHYLSRHRILAVKRVKSEDMELIARLTQGIVVGSADDLTPDKLGKAGSVEEIRFRDEERSVMISGCKGKGTATLILRGSSKHVLDEGERSLKAALRVIVKLLDDPRITFGGGATEMELARGLRSYALTFTGKEQFAVQQYSRALEAIPRILAENAGLDVVETIASLRKSHGSGQSWFGVEAIQGRVADMREVKVFDPLIVKLNVIKAATELAIMILRISGIGKARKKRKKDEGSTDEAGERERKEDVEEAKEKNTINPRMNTPPIE